MPDLWNLNGLSDVQRPAVAVATIEIRFPWLWLRPKLHYLYNKYQIPVRTRDLNTGSTSVAEHVHDDKGNKAHVLMAPGSRDMIAGLAWSNGMIEIDTRIGAAQAKEIFSAECAHAVDFFWMTGTREGTWTDVITPMREAIWRILHGGTFEPHPGHDWFGHAEYGNQIGEGWMGLFTHSYSDYTPWQDMWVHRGIEEMTPAVISALEPPSVLVGLTGYTAVHKQSCYIVRRWRAKGRAYRQTRELAWYDLATARSWSGRRPCLTCRPT